MLKKWIVRRLVEFHWGQFMYGKVAFVISLLILVKVYKMSNMTKILIVVAGAVLTWISGYLFNRYFRKDFQKQMYKDTLYKNENYE